jgi:ASC-1-like (ASCH) protein
MEQGTSNFTTYHNHRVEPYFSYVKNGQKTIEGRLRKEWYRFLKPGDHIIVHRQDDEDDTVEVVVKDVRPYSSIREMLEREPLKRLLPDVDTVEEGLTIYRKFYTEEQEREYGALAVEVERLR